MSEAGGGTALCTVAAGRRLRRARRSRGKSLAVIAGLAGISTSYLSRLESGHPRGFTGRAVQVGRCPACAGAAEQGVSAPESATRHG